MRGRLVLLMQAHEACEHARQADDSNDYHCQNEAFHHEIHAGGDNTWLAEQARNVQRRLWPYRRLQLHGRKRVVTSFSEHEEFVRAITEGEENRAAELLRNHILLHGQRLADVIALLSQDC